MNPVVAPTDRGDNSDQRRTLFERIVVLLCILLRMDSRPYIGLPKMPKGHHAPLASKEHRPPAGLLGSTENSWGAREPGIRM